MTGEGSATEQAHSLEDANPGYEPGPPTSDAGELAPLLTRAVVPEEPARPPLVEAQIAPPAEEPAAPVAVATAAPAAPVPRPRATVTADRVAAAGSAVVLSPSEVYSLTLEVSGDAAWATWATRVIACESGGRVNAVSPAGHYGLGQVAAGHPYDFSRMLSEPRYAVEAMLAIYRASGPGAWSCK